MTFRLNPSVESVAFHPVTNETINGELTNSEIDRPAYGHNSQRIFPDSKFPTDPVNHKRVKVKAMVGKPNVTVYFKNFDVDDPSSNPIIDDTGNLGNDNHAGRIVGGAYPPFARGTLSNPSAVSNANGEAVVYFTVTAYAGDNFRVAASTNQNDLNGVMISGTALVDADNVTLARSSKAKQTELLTVWRKVHLEVDSMAEVRGNAVNGSFPIGTYHDVGTEPVWVTIGGSFTNLEPYRYRQLQRPDMSWIDGGRLSIGFGNSSLRVLDNTNNAILVKSDNGIVPIRARQNFNLFDDDDYNSNDGSLWRGDDLEDIDSRFNYSMGYCENNETLAALCSTSDVQRNPYAAAYIEPEYHWARSVPGMNDTDVRFELIVNRDPLDVFADTEREVINAKRDSAAMENNDFWIGYILLGYQSSINFDPPPEGYPAIAPAAPGVGANAFTNSANSNQDVTEGAIGAILYLETMRDIDFSLFENTRIFTAPHELGHQFGLKGDNSQFITGVTTWGLMGYTSSYDLQLIPHHIKVLRFRSRSPGSQ